MSPFWTFRRCTAALVLVSVSACGGNPPVVGVSVPAPTKVTFLDDPKPLRFHSARFELSVPFPDGHGWRIDDHHAPLLHATHAGTGSVLDLGLSSEPDLMNRQRCEAVARERGLVHDADFQTVDDEVIVGPGPYDTHVVVAALPSKVPHHTLAGHVFVFGAYLRKCLFAHYETALGAGEDEATLSARLAVVRLQVIGGLKVETFDTPTLEKR